MRGSLFALGVVGIVSAVGVASVFGCGGPSDRPENAKPTAEPLSPSEVTQPPKPVAQAVPSASKPFTVASYNINAGMSGNAETLEAIASLDSDIILLQEVTRGWVNVLDSVHATSHPHRIFHVDRRHHYGGLGILSRYPIRDAEVLANKPGPFPAWRGIISHPKGPIEVVNVHLFPPVRWIRSRGLVKAYEDGQAIHAKELAHFWPLLANSSNGRPLIIAGDFNENRNGVAVGNMKEHGLEPAHSGMDATWRWKLRNGFEVTFQLDHILVRGLVATATEIRREGSSDHFPIEATLDFPKAPRDSRH